MSAASTAAPVWLTMTDEQRRVTLHAMARFGGSFVSRLAEAWQRADFLNGVKLGAAFADYVRQYGPGSDAYAEAARREGIPAEPLPVAEAVESDWGAFDDATRGGAGE